MFIYFQQPPTVHECDVSPYLINFVKDLSRDLGQG